VKHRYFAIPNTGVPVVEVAAAGLKMAETLVRLRRSVGLAKSEHINAPFRTPPREAVDQARRTFGFKWMAKRSRHCPKQGCCSPGYARNSCRRMNSCFPAFDSVGSWSPTAPYRRSMLAVLNAVNASTEVLDVWPRERVKQISHRE
jgi:hypothetical protein